jgi:putative heme-binding domain-containing protein
MSKNRNLSMKLHFTLSALFLLGVSISCSDKVPASGQAGLVNPKVEKLRLQEGFQAEHLYSPAENDHGSWVAMTFDNKGRLITSDQYGALYRLEIPAVGSNSVKPKIEKLAVGKLTGENSADSIGMGYAQGLLWAFNSLYVMVNNHHRNEEFDRGSGLYRLQDTDGDDQFDKVSLLKSLKGSGEHGPHSVVLGPDKKSLYVIAGNHTDVPEMDAYRLPAVWQEDNLFPQIKDPRGHANSRKAPGGWIARVDSLGEDWELISAGYRNPFDLAFNEEGDMFTYDSDMEWDFGLPWYRPTRICHVTSGSEYGWRTGNGKWSTVYPDNLPPVLNIGQGSPTNLVYGGNARFPEKYRKALFAFDWSFGIIYAISLQPQGASYRATAEEFISGSPLPLTDGVMGPDGALYFLTGGRRLESDLYRVYYENADEENLKLASNKSSVKEIEEKEIRKQLEQYHKRNADAGAIDFAWPYLKHQDRFVRYAARLAVEHQPLSQWQERAFNEKDPRILTQAIIALARHGDQNLKDRMLKALMTVNYEKLTEEEQLDLLRGIELVLYRKGKPDAATKNRLVNYLNPHYPAGTNHLNRSLSKILVHLEAPEAVAKTLALLDKAKDDDSDQQTVTASSDLILRNPQYGLDIARMLAKTPPAQQTYYATVLSEAKTGWTPELHEKYFKWIYNAFNYEGGRSYIGFIDKARQKALSYVPENKLAYYNTISGDSLLSGSGNDLTTVGRPEGPGRRWTMEEALPLVENGLENRNRERGRQLFAATLCASCHSIQGEGGAVGPDLTQLGNRFSSKDILEATIHPSRVVSDQYAATAFYLKDGNSVVGRLMNEDDDTYFISQNPFAPQELREIPKSKVTRTKISDASVMLPGLINSLNPEELKDLMAYLISAGNEEHKVYASAGSSDNEIK